MQAETMTQDVQQPAVETKPETPAVEETWGAAWARLREKLLNVVKTAETEVKGQFKATTDDLYEQLRKGLDQVRETLKAQLDRLQLPVR